MLRPVKTIAVTGAAGFLGRHLCDHFRRQGWTVRALMRRPDLYPFHESGIDCVKCILPHEIDPAAFEGVDLLIHCAYATRHVSQQEAFWVNHLGTKAIYTLSRSSGVGRFVFISSTGAHPSAESYYGRSKFSLEQLFDPAKDLIIRAGLVLGDDEHCRFGQMVELIRRSSFVPLFDGGRQILQTIHIDDLCRAIDAAIQKRLTGTFVVAEPEGLELRECFRLIAARLGRRCRFIPLPLAPTLALIRLLEALHVRLPLSSENLLGLKHLIHQPAAEDLARIGITVKTADQSLALCPR